ncbi:hypothetical protein BH23CHL2_BH23CHL2_30970 [soil metagenome]
MALAIEYRVEIDPPSDQEVADFLDREWAAWHAQMDHDPSVDWSGSSVRFVARDGAGSVVGAAVGRIGAGVGHLGELMVASDARREGIGTELVRQFEEHCTAHGCHKLTVHTDLSGPAHDFYLGLGWRQEAVFRRDRGGRDFVRLYTFTADQ